MEIHFSVCNVTLPAFYKLHIEVYTEFITKNNISYKLYLFIYLPNFFNNIKSFFLSSSVCSAGTDLGKTFIRYIMS